MTEDDPTLAVAAYVKLLRATRSVIARVEPRLAEYSLTSTQLGVLDALLHKGPLSHRDLGRKVLTSAANMSDVIDKLAARGLVTRVRCPEDRRLVRVMLTASGQALITELFPHHAQDIATAMAGLGAADLSLLGDLLRRLGMAAEQVPAEPCLAAACPGELPPCPACDIEPPEACPESGATLQEARPLSQ